MRKTFISNLNNSQRDDIFLMVGDVGFSVIEEFETKYPKQYLNAGIAEQNMAGMAAGLALSGKKVIVYSIANFNTVRCLEQIRNDICYHNLDVSIVSVGGGFVYGSAGYSHHAVQDISFMGSLPFMTLLLPADKRETQFCVDHIMNNGGPKYLRLGKNGERDIHSDDFKLQKINLLTSNKKPSIVIVTVGTIAAVAIDVQNNLRDNECIDIDVVTCPIIDSGFETGIRDVLSSYKQIFVVEEHVECFGFASLIKKYMEDVSVQIFSKGVDKNMPKIVGDQSFLRDKHGLNIQWLSEWIIKNKN